MTDYRFELVLTIAEAITVLNREGKTKGTRFFVQVNQHAPIHGEAGYYFPVMTNIKVSKKDAVKFIQDAYKNYENRGARVRVRALDKCVFIG